MAAISSSITSFVRARPSLTNLLRPLASWYANAAGYRQLGLRYDDLLSEESEVGQLALKRLSPAQTYERVFRLRRAMQYSLMQKLPPKSEWTRAEDVSLQLVESFLVGVNRVLI